MALIRRGRDAQQQHAADRLWRGAAAGSLATAGTTIAHHAGGGDVPSFLVVVTSLAATTLIATSLTGRRLGASRILVVAGAAQVLFHILFSTLSAHPTLASAAGHHHGTLPAGFLSSAGAAGLAAGGAGALASDPMLWSHVLATILIAALVSRGEALATRSLSGLLRWVRRATGVLSGWPHPEAARQPGACSAPVARLRSARLTVAPARGPPAATA